MPLIQNDTRRILAVALPLSKGKSHATSARAREKSAIPEATQHTYLLMKYLVAGEEPVSGRLELHCVDIVFVSFFQFR